MTELHNLSLFVSALAKFLLMTGVGIGGAIALIAECCGWKIVALGIEQVSGRAVSHMEKSALSDGNKPARKEWRVA